MRGEIVTLRRRHALAGRAGLVLLTTGLALAAYAGARENAAAFAAAVALLAGSVLSAYVAGRARARHRRVVLAARAERLAARAALAPRR